MAKSSLLTTFFAFTTLLAGGWAWIESSQRPAEAGSFEQRRIALLEAEVERMREVASGLQSTLRLQEDAAKRPEFEKLTASLRRLVFRSPVKYEVLERSDIPRIIEEKMNENLTPEEFENFRIGYVAMGLLPADYPLREKLVEMMTEQIGAYYDPEEKKVVTFANATLDQFMSRAILVHELVHVLQDQHFDLLKFPLKLKTNDDRVAAASALAEGDAMRIMNQYMTTNMSGKAALEAFTTLLQSQTEKLLQAPRFLREGLMFPYQEGAIFANYLYEVGGEETLNAAFLKPPTSSLQILYPEKYLLDEAPLVIGWKPEPVLGEPVLLDNVMGALGMRILLTEWGNELEPVNSLISEWRGDRYLVYKTGNGVAAIWRSSWESEESREAFEKAVQTMVAKRYNATVAADGAWQAPERTLRFLKLDGRQAVLIDAPSPEWADALAALYCQPLPEGNPASETLASQ